jgi:hypothetical protein
MRRHAAQLFVKEAFMDPATLVLLAGLALGTADNEVTYANIHQPVTCMSLQGVSRCGDYRDKFYGGREYNTAIYGSHPGRFRLYGVLAAETGSAYALQRILKNHKYLGLLPGMYVAGNHAYGLSFSLRH